MILVKTLNNYSYIQQVKYGLYATLWIQELFSSEINCSKGNLPKRTKSEQTNINKNWAKYLDLPAINQF